MSSTEPKRKSKPSKRKVDLKQAKTAHKKAAFLRAYRKLGGKATASESIGVDRDTVWGWEQTDEKFRADVLRAEELDTEELEKVARARAKKKSDLLMMFLLKGRKPATYRDNVKIEHSGSVTVKDLLLKDDGKEEGKKPG